MPLPLAAFLILAALLGGCQGGERDHPAAGRARSLPDILLVSVDTLRADRLGCYGHAAAQTPVIDALAAAGVLFEQAYTTVPITLPAHASLLTGLVPPRHGVRDNGAFRLPSEIPTLAEALLARGYQTGAFIGGLPLERSRGLDRGFEVYDDAMPQRSLGALAEAMRAERVAEEVLAAALLWLGRQPADRPAFAFVHLYDPHAPYEKSLPGRAVPDYDGEVAHVDRELGRFLAALDERRPRSRLTLVTSDHGEGLGDHGEATHSLFAYDSTLHIPWILHWPEELSPLRIAGVVGIVDLLPTLLELVGLDGAAAGNPSIDGSSRASAARGGEPPERAVLYFESLFGELRFGWAPLRGLRAGGWKYIDLPRPELYDLTADPGESTNLASARPGLAASMARRVAAVETGARASADLDPETAARLAALGYVAAPPAKRAAPSEAVDPKDGISAYEGFQRAHDLALQGQLGESLELLAKHQAAFRHSPYFHSQRGNLAATAERWELAIASYRACLDLQPTHRDCLLNLGVAWLGVDQPAEALARFEDLLAIDPDHPTALLYAGVVAHNALRDLGRARGHWERFLAVAPEHPEAGKIRQALAAMGAHSASGSSRPSS